MDRKPKDEIVDEIHKLREAYATQFDFDLEKMYADLKRKESLNQAIRAQSLPLKPKPSIRA